MVFSKADSLAEGELPVGVLTRLDRRRGRGWQVLTDFVIVHLVDYTVQGGLASSYLVTVRWACCEFQGVDGLLL